jgi:hypothetical protein
VIRSWDNRLRARMEQLGIRKIEPYLTGSWKLLKAVNKRLGMMSAMARSHSFNRSTNID